MKEPRKKKLKMKSYPAYLNTDFSITLTNKAEPKTKESLLPPSVPIRLIVVQGWEEKLKDK